GFSLGAQPNDPTTAGSGEVTMETSVLHEDGSGTVLETDARSGAFDLPPSQTITLGPAGDGETRETERDYSGSPCNLAVLSELKNYDYGSDAHGPVLSQTVYAYAAFAATPMFPAGPSICDRPSSVVTEDGSGNRVAETDYAYDQASPAPTSGLYGKDYSSGNYGNVTTESRWVSTTDSSLNTTFTYDDTGQLLTETNPLDAALGKNTETISYADNYAGGNPATPTDAYPTTITDALGHTRQYSWIYASGELASSTDENGNVTTFTYGDPLARLTQVNYPDDGETTYAYDDAPPSPTVTTSKEISSGDWLTTASVQDGMGHVVETETTSDPAGTDYVATAYDGEGQVLSVTNPYRSTSDPTYGVTSYTYDALGRTLAVTQPDGSVLTTTYTGRATEVADEGNGSYNVTRISQVDGLGRLASVCEVDSAAMPVGGGATPVTCGQDIAATGFLATYDYDALGDLTSVAQSGLNSRSFAYDSLSRLTSATNPESGTLSYAYDTAACGAVAAPGELTCRTDARGITTAYSYDADSRLTGKSYSDGTPSVQLIYDEASPWSVGATNTTGRLTTAQTWAGSVLETGEIFSYDAMGRVAMNDQCTPQDCGNGHDVLTYGYDLLGDMTSATNGEGVTLSYGYNNAARLASITSSLSDANHPGNLFSTPSYDAGGQLAAATYGNNENEADAYSDRMQLTSRSVTGAAGVDPTAGQGSISVSGNEQSVQIPSTHSTGSITIEGGESGHEVIKCPAAKPGQAVPDIGCSYTWYYNSGTVSLTVNGVTTSTGYAEGSTDSNVASALKSAVNGDASMPVTAAVSGAVVSLTSKGLGTGADYSLATACTYSYSPYFKSCSFYGSLSGAAMTGGSDVTDYDSGTVSADIDGQTVSAAYNQTTNTASLVAQALATAITNGSSYGTASASGATVAITARCTGVATNYSLSASSATGDPGQFSSPSFSPSASGSALAGGQNGQGSGAYSVTGITRAPDGDVTGATDSVNGQWRYEYGPLNRLLEACSDTCSSPTTAAGYVYDRFGNRWQQNALAGAVPAPQLSFDANNHIVGASYDASGDLLEDATGNTYTYNAQHRIASADSGNIQYVYNAMGQRVEKIVGGVAKYYLYDPAGQAVTVLDQNGNWLRGEIFASGRHIATYADNTTYFDYSDWLGTERLTATVNGYEQDACTSLPFGDAFNCTGSADPSPLHFTGQQHDNETGLDHFSARNYTPTWGLFTSPDDGAGQSVADPQSWDFYAYVRGNPASLTDPSGRTYCKAGAEITGGKTPSKDCISDAAFAKLSKASQGGYVQVSKDITITVAGQAPPPIPLVGVAQPGGDPFLALATDVTRLNPGGFIRDFEIQAIITGATGPLLGGVLGDAAEFAAAGGEIVTEPAEVAARAASAVGNQSITVPSREVAEQAVDEFLGPDKQPLLQQFGNRAGRQVGWKSADGLRLVRDDAAAPNPHFNFQDLRTGSNLHVFF
ncbi:MAG: RHS repeat-associated core domain-containing protein, partial [Terriglobales bacterium]